MRKVSIGLTCALASWSSAKACSPPPLKAATEATYEQKLKPYFINSHRKMVDEAENILVGKFRYSLKRKKHILHISKRIKEPASATLARDVKVSFHQIDDDRIKYEKRHPEMVFDEFILDWFWPVNYPHGIEGSYGPSDCSLSLNIIEEADYLVFANNELEISSMVLLRRSKQSYKSAIEKMVEDPLEKYGISFTLQEMLNRGSNLQILTTKKCLPAPIYTIVKSSVADNQGKEFLSRPIQIYDDQEERYSYEIPKSDIKAAITKGEAKGLYTNSPAMKECRVGQNYLMLGQFLYSDIEGYSGQMIAEENGYFQLDNTVFEHHISPELISHSSILMLLNTQTTP